MRLKGLWEPIAYKLNCETANSAETITFSVAPDIDGFYSVGTTVTITAYGSSTTPVSAFVKWHGDIPNGVDPTTNPITVTMDRAKTIIPEFRREGFTQAVGSYDYEATGF